MRVIGLGGVVEMEVDYWVFQVGMQSVSGDSGDSQWRQLVEIILL